MIRYIYLFIISILFSNSNFNELDINAHDIVKLKNDWYQTISFTHYHQDVTRSNAEDKAINDALSKIINYHSGVRINSATLSYSDDSIDHFNQFISSMSTGIVLDKEIIFSDLIKMSNGEYYYKVELKAKIGELKGKDDPKFILRANLNRDIYQDGDEMILDVSSSKDCYVYIFNILPDETVSTLVPSQYLNNNFLQRGKTLSFPPNNDIKLKVTVPEDKEYTSEMLIVLGIKKENKKKDEVFNFNLDNHISTMNELMKFIMDFPKDQIKQVTQVYIIKK
tara:strand:+ start:119 stop:958 length:840 start_codon:yes stop_codon:yes gene_type:complete